MGELSEYEGSWLGLELRRPEGSMRCRSVETFRWQVQGKKICLMGKVVRCRLQKRIEASIVVLRMTDSRRRVVLRFLRKVHVEGGEMVAARRPTFVRSAFRLDDGDNM